MKRIHQGAAVFFILFSMLVVWKSWDFEYYTPLGPGPGFFPLWLGGIMGGLSLIWLLQVSRGEGCDADEAFLPERAGAVRLLSIIFAMVAATLLMDFLGYQLPMFLLLVFILWIPGRQNIWMTLIIATLGSVGVSYVFRNYLEIQLPEATVPFLHGLGI